MKSRWILLKGVHSPYEQYSAKRVVVKVESEVSGVYRTESHLPNYFQRLWPEFSPPETTFFRYLSLKPINRLRFTKLSGEQGGTEVDIKINHAEGNSPAWKHSSLVHSYAHWCDMAHPQTAVCLSCVCWVVAQTPPKVMTLNERAVKGASCVASEKQCHFVLKRNTVG